MTEPIPPLPEPKARPTVHGGGLHKAATMEQAFNHEMQHDFRTFPAYTADQMRQFGEQCYLAGVQAERERAARDAERYRYLKQNAPDRHMWSDESIDAAIRKGTTA
jgi:hypothetical protein